MRGEMLSHPLDLIGLIDLIIPKIVTSSNNISVRVCLVIVFARFQCNSFIFGWLQKTPSNQ